MSKLHPLAIQICGQSIMQTDPIGVDDMDKIIRQYLQERAEWLKKQSDPNHYAPLCITVDSFVKLCKLIDISLELDLSIAEKEEPDYCKCAKPEKCSAILQNLEQRVERMERCLAIQDSKQ